MWLGWCLVERGEFARGLAQALAALEVAESVEEPWDLMVASLGLGLAHATQGRFAEAIGPLERADALGREHGIQTFRGLAAHYLGYAYFRAGRTDQGVELLETAAGLPPQLQSVNHSRVLTDLAEAYLVARHVADAVVVGERALALAWERGERLNEAWALRLVAEIAAHRDPRDIDTGEVRYRDALTLAEELGARPLVAHCHLGLGELYAKVGKPLEARAQLNAAIELYRAMEMTFWLPRVESALACLR
jgi:tetratricopeptide (TPR) repeat protein